MKRDNNSRRTAKENKETFYFSCVPCKRCTTNKRSTASGNCYKCDNTRKYNKRINTNWEAERKQAKEYAKAHPEKRRANIRCYQARKLNAVPSWANKDLIEVKYIEAKIMEWLTGAKYHVDHIVPLQGEDVCGLHVENNLQVIPAIENIKKSNKMEI